MGGIALIVGRWLLARWIWVLGAAALTWYTAHWYHKGQDNVNKKLDKQYEKVDSAWDKIDRQPDDVGIALRRLRQRAH